MKNSFLKMVLAVICGILIMTILSLLILSGIFSAFGAAGKSKTALPRSGVLLMDMSTLAIGEQNSEADPVSMVQGATSTLGLWNAVRAINTAADDPSIKYIYLKPDGAMAGISQMEELRTALSNFRLSGKPVVAFIENPSTAGYYLASVADKIYMTSYLGSTISLTGVGSQLIFLKDLLDKLGVNVQLIRHGRYKSAGEMYVRSESSEDNLMQNQTMINGIWNAYAKAIAEGRGMSVERVNEVVDGLMLTCPQDFLDLGFVDALVTEEEMRAKLADLAVVDKWDDVKMVGLRAYADAKLTVNLKARQKIAVIYASGNIVDGKAKQNVAGDRFASIISKVRADSTVKAVVLRVNSPGGSVLASEKIKAELDLLREVKPLIASYGDYAASGGYWISANCDKVFSDETTLTGSIGVFSMIPDFSGTLKNVAHVNVTTVNSNAHSDLYSLMRPLDTKEKEYMQKFIEDVYSRFVSIDSEGRSLDPEFVDSIAQGRVWTGHDGLEIGLVDTIGTLEDAIHWAASCVSADNDSSLEPWRIVEYPAPLSQMDMLLTVFGNDPEEVMVFKGTVFENAARTLWDLSERWSNGSKDFTFASLPYAIDIR